MPSADEVDGQQLGLLVDTARGTLLADLARAEHLATLVGQFKTEDDGWFDDVLIAEMNRTLAKAVSASRPLRLAV